MIRRNSQARSSLADYFDWCADEGVFDEFSPEEMLIATDLVRQMSILPGHKTLEPGCGTGRLTRLLAEMVGPKGKVFAFDISPRMVGKCVARNLPPHVEVAQASAMSLPLPDREFDAIVCVNAFPHFEDASAVLCEFHRILRKEGVLWVAHTHSREWVNSLHSSIGGILSTHLLPTNAEFEGLLRESGFSLALLHDLPDRFLLKAVPIL